MILHFEISLIVIMKHKIATQIVVFSYVSLILHLLMYAYDFVNSQPIAMYIAECAVVQHRCLQINHRMALTSSTERNKADYPENVSQVELMLKQCCKGSSQI